MVNESDSPKPVITGPTSGFTPGSSCRHHRSKPRKDRFDRAKILGITRSLVTCQLSDQHDTYVEILEEIGLQDLRYVTDVLVGMVVENVAEEAWLMSEDDECDPLDHWRNMIAAQLVDADIL